MTEPKDYVVVTSTILAEWFKKKRSWTREHLITTTGLSPSVVDEQIKVFCSENDIDLSTPLSVEHFPKVTWGRLSQDWIKSAKRYIRREAARRAEDELQNQTKDPVVPGKWKDQMQQTISKLTSLSGVAFGGTIAADRMDRFFNLMGTPRIDISVHIPDGREIDDVLSGFLTEDDLVECPEGMFPIVVIHAVRRASSLFDSDSEIGTMADPLEVLCGLNDLRLSEQLEELYYVLTRPNAG